MLLAFGMTLVIAAAPNGEAIFKEHCTHWHREDGKGKLAVGTPDFTNAKTQDSLTDGEIIGTIANGRKGTLMPAWKVVTRGDFRRRVLTCALSVEVGGSRVGSKRWWQSRNTAVTGRVYSGTLRRLGEVAHLCLRKLTQVV